MHERKSMMAQLADGFITFPGGIGTFEEFFEVYTWKKLGFHNKPCGLLNVNNYFGPIIQMLSNAEEEGFLLPADKKLLVQHGDVIKLLDMMTSI
jgi:uncharacterized protein (TIGR00730 family)